jgi:hypothetical protein
LTFPPETYFGLGAAVLTVCGVLLWALRGKKPPAPPEDRSEPAAAMQDATMQDDVPIAQGEPVWFDPEVAPAPSGRFQEPREPDYPPVALADWTASRPDADRLASATAIACEYKGFKIALAERQPGLWIGIVTADGKKKKRPEPWTTREFYQRPAALAEAKALVDRAAL